MSLVATLIADPRVLPIDDLLMSRAASSVGGTIDVLAPGVACDLLLPEQADSSEVERRIRDAAGSAPVDIVVQDVRIRRKSILVADMDSTMIGQECIDELAAEVGLKDHVARITARAMNGEIAFEPALRERVALLRGLQTSVIAQVLSTRITPMPGAKTLIATMRAHGAYTALVSGGFTAFTGPVAAMLGFDEHRANVLDEENGRLSGTVREPVLGKQAKVDALLEIANRLNRSPGDAIAVGDGANDLAMLACAGSGVALHAKPSVAALARMRVDHGDLTALLYIQGYRETEFVS